MKSRDNITLAVLVGLLVCIGLVGRFGLPGWSILTPVAPAPFPADKLCVLIVEDTDPGSRDKLTPDQREIITSNADGSVRKVVLALGGEIRFVDPTPAPDLQYDAQWVRDAYAVKRDGTLPVIVASNGKTGFGPMPIAEPAAKVVERLKSMGGK